LIDKSHIRAVAGADRVPGALLRGWGKEQATELVGESTEAADALPFVAGGAVEVEH
jgi:hypothetical protein